MRTAEVVMLALMNRRGASRDGVHAHAADRINGRRRSVTQRKERVSRRMIGMIVAHVAAPMTEDQGQLTCPQSFYGATIGRMDSRLGRPISRAAWWIGAAPACRATHLAGTAPSRTCGRSQR